MKKILALCLTVVILLAMMPIIGASATDAVTFSVSNATGYPGDEVSVAVSIGTNPGLTFAQIKVGYFAEALEVVSIEKLSFAGKTTSCSPATANPIKVTYDNCLEDIYDNGDLAIITFKINENAAPGNYKLTVGAEQENVFDIAYNDIPFVCVSGVITVNCSHGATTTHDAVESTCTVAGNDEYVTCNICGEVVEGSDAELPLADHTWADVVADEYLSSDATCTELAAYYKSCSVCGAKSDVKFTAGELLAHAWVENADDLYLVTEATCTELATYYVSCSDCGVAGEETFEAGELLAHNWANVEAEEYFASEATCTELATYYVSCSDCGVASAETFEVGELAEHTYGEWVEIYKPTFDYVGTKEKVCSVCGDSVTEDIPVRIPAEFSVSNVKGAPGEVVEVVVSIDSNPGITGASLWLDYNSDVLEILEFVSADLGGVKAECSEVSSNPAIIRWIGFEDSYATGAIVTIKFMIKEDAVDADYDLVLSTTQDEVFDEDFDDVKFNLTNGIFKVSSVCYHTGSTTTYPAVASNCLVHGNDEYVVCDECGEIIEGTDAELPLGDHTWGMNVADEYLATYATCVNKATYYTSCSICGEMRTDATFEGGEVNPDVHEGETTTHEPVDSTCAVPGHAEYVTCNDCGAVVAGSDADLPLVRHEIRYVDGKEATCTEIGWESYLECVNCDYSTYEEIPMVRHEISYVDAKAPTCTEIGWDSYLVCVNCDYSTYEEIPALGHTLVYVDEKLPTCSEYGWYAYEYCSECDYSTEKTNGNLLPHTWANIVADEYLISAATCFERAVYYVSCSECGATNNKAAFADGAFDPNNHVGETTTHAAVESSCTVAGNDEYVTCNDCGVVVAGSDAKLPLARHEVRYVHAKEATCTEIGWDTYAECINCDYTTYEEIAALGHDIVKYDAVDATCTEDGCNAYEACSRCDYSTQKVIPAIGHAWVEVVDDKYLATAATCTAKATYYVSCSNCGIADEAVTFEAGELAPHTYDSEDDYTCNACKFARTPNAPVVEDAKPFAITLVAVEGFEYSIDGINWQASNVFEGLEPRTEYTFYQRVAATEANDASEISEGTVVETSVLPGDVNGDGVVNGKDCVLLTQSLNGWDVEIIEVAADVDNSGSVNNKDLVAIIRYLNGWGWEA